MRIIDWSSDVCASDLIDDLHSLAFIHLAPKINCFKKARVLNWIYVASPNRLVEQWPVAAPLVLVSPVRVLQVDKFPSQLCKIDRGSMNKVIRHLHRISNANISVRVGNWLRN